MNSSDRNLPTYSSPVAGVLIPIAGVSVIKMILSGVAYGLGGLLLLSCGGVMTYIGLTESNLALAGLAVPFVLIGILFALTAVRRWRAAFDSRIFLRAGPDGAVIGMPSGKRANILRWNYEFVVHEIIWNEIRTWYPFVMRVNGIPTETSLVFERTNGPRLTVPLLYLAGSQKRIANEINQAISRTELRDVRPSIVTNVSTNEHDPFH